MRAVSSEEIKYESNLLLYTNSENRPITPKKDENEGRHKKIEKIHTKSKSMVRVVNNNPRRASSKREEGVKVLKSPKAKVIDNVGISGRCCSRPKISINIEESKWECGILGNMREILEEEGLEYEYEIEKNRNRSSTRSSIQSPNITKKEVSSGSSGSSGSPGSSGSSGSPGSPNSPNIGQLANTTTSTHTYISRSRRCKFPITEGISVSPISEGSPSQFTTQALECKKKQLDKVFSEISGVDSNIYKTTQGESMEELKMHVRPPQQSPSNQNPIDHFLIPPQNIPTGHESPTSLDSLSSNTLYRIEPEYKKSNSKLGRMSHNPRTGTEGGLFEKEEIFPLSVPISPKNLGYTVKDRRLEEGFHNNTYVSMCPIEGKRVILNAEGTLPQNQIGYLNTRKRELIIHQEKIDKEALINKFTLQTGIS